MSIPFFKPAISSQDAAAVRKTLMSGHLTTGPRCQEFEARFAEILGVRHAISVSSCSAGLHLALAVARIGPGDVVFIPALAFPALAQAAEWQGATPVLVDSEPETLCMCPSALRRTVREVVQLEGEDRSASIGRPRAVIVIDYGGQMADYSAIRAVCDEYSMILMEDAAHTMISQWRETETEPWKSPGQVADIACFSFYATKPITTGEGGMVVTDNDEWADEIRSMRLHGFQSMTDGSRSTVWTRKVVRRGYKYNLPDTAAALGISQLTRAEELSQARRTVAQRYDEHLRDHELLRLPREMPNRRHSWHLYVVRLRGPGGQARNDLVRHLDKCGVETSIHWHPLHCHQYYRDRLPMLPNCKVVDETYPCMLSLPMFPLMTQEETTYVSESLIAGLANICRSQAREKDDYSASPAGPALALADPTAPGDGAGRAGMKFKSAVPRFEGPLTTELPEGPEGMPEMGSPKRQTGISLDASPDTTSRTRQSAGNQKLSTQAEPSPPTAEASPRPSAPPARERGRSLREWLLPYGGAWHVPWVLQRYFRSAMTAFRPGKLFNVTRALAEMKLKRTRLSSRPFVLRVEACNVCNLRCPLCACGTGKDPRPKGFMELADFKYVLDQNKRAAMILRLDGMGESTLHPKVFDMIGMAKDYGLSVTLHSNLNTPASSRAGELIDSGLDRLVVDIEGTTQETYQKYRIGGDYSRVVSNVRRLIELRKELGRSRPIIEVQFIDFGWNHDEIPRLRQLTREWGADRFTICAPEPAARKADFNPDKPRRCFWLWTTLTVGWALNYVSCTNAWSLPWPRLNMRDVPPHEYWNHPLMQDARNYNINKSADSIAEDTGCKCNRCYEMLAIPLTGPYFCE
jgi:perosamine synthetase